jgi:hypothetical protein
MVVTHSLLSTFQTFSGILLVTSPTLRGMKISWNYYRKPGVCILHLHLDLASPIPTLHLSDSENESAFEIARASVERDIVKLLRELSY